eukprot:scaffold32301_cov135-Isochrysis_galbana.AAC.17
MQPAASQPARNTRAVRRATTTTTLPAAGLSRASPLVARRVVRSLCLFQHRTLDTRGCCPIAPCVLPCPCPRDPLHTASIP